MGKNIRRITIRVPAAIHKHLVAKAAEEHRSVQGHLLALIEASLKGDGTPAGTSRSPTGGTPVRSRGVFAFRADTSRHV